MKKKIAEERRVRNYKSEPNVTDKAFDNMPTGIPKIWGVMRRKSAKRICNETAGTEKNVV